MSIALVTGGNRGIGFEVCRQLAQKGYAVILGSRDAAKGEDAAKRLQNEGLNVTAKQLDVTNENTLQEVYRWLENEHGRLDVLINNAGIDYDTDQNVLSADLGRVKNVFDVNTLGPWRVAQVFIPLLKKSEHGRLVNVSSGAGALSSMSGGTPAYSMSKAALNALTCFHLSLKVTASWSTLPGQVGSQRIWAARADDLPKMEPRASYGSQPYRMTDRRAGFFGMGSKWSGERKGLSAEVKVDSFLSVLSPFTFF